MVGVWSVEPEYRLWTERMGMGWRLAVETEHGDGVEIGCVPPPTPCGYLPEEDKKAVSVAQPHGKVPEASAV